MKKHLFLFTLFASCFLLSFSQEKTAKEHVAIAKKYMNYDYLGHKYKYLDENYAIHISSEEFQDLIRKHRFFPNAIKTYKDSISVVMSGEFDNPYQPRIATNHITMTWRRVSYYLWLSPEKTKEIGMRYSFRMPHQLYNYIFYEQNNWDAYMTNLITELRNKVFKNTGYNKVLSMNSDSLQQYVLIYSPDRIRDAKELKPRSEKAKEGCGSPSCSHKK